MLSNAEREDVRRIFAAHGYTEPLRVAPVTSEDERVFLFSPTALAHLPQRTLVAELTAALGRKVWIANEAADWGGPPQSLS